MDSSSPPPPPGITVPILPSRPPVSARRTPAAQQISDMALMADSDGGSDKQHQQYASGAASTSTTTAAAAPYTSVSTVRPGTPLGAIGGGGRDSVRFMSSNSLDGSPGRASSSGNGRLATMADRGLLHTFLEDWIGPEKQTRFHRSTGWRRLLHVLATMAVVSATALFISVVLVVFTSLGPLVFNLKGSSIIPVLAIVFYGFVYVLFARSILRTSLRVLLSMWTSDIQDLKDDPDRVAMRMATQARKRNFGFFSVMAKPGLAIRRAFYAVVHVGVDKWYTMRLHRRTAKGRKASPIQTPSNLDLVSSLEARPVESSDTVVATSSLDSESPESIEQEKAELRELLRHALLFVALFFVVLIPCVVIAARQGYYAIVSWLSFVVVAGTLALILFINFANRIHRTGRFLYLLWNGNANGTPIANNRRLAMFVASSGRDHKLDPIDSLVELFIKVTAVALIIGMLFIKQGSSNKGRIVLAIILAVLLAYRLRGMLSCGFMSTAKPPGYFRGENMRTPLAVFASRLIMTGFGLAFVAALDLSQLVADQEQTTVLDLISRGAMSFRSLLIAFVCVYILSLVVVDLAMIAVKVVRPRVAAILITLCLIVRIVIAATLMAVAPGYTATAIGLLTYISFDFRDGRAYWTSSGDLHRNMSHRRAAMDGLITFSITVLAVVASILIGLVVNLGKSQPVLDPVFPDDPRAVFVTQHPMCTMTYANGALTPLDLGVFAGSSYGKNETAAIDYTQRNPRLRGQVSVAYSNLNETSGVHFLEYRLANSPSFSIVAVRGTSDIEDILQDLYAWAAPAMLQLSSMFGTTVGLWPRELTANFVKFLADYVAHSSLLYYQEVDRHVRDLVQNGNRSVIITGHSLGGGVAQIVGARQGVPALALSSPGLGLSYRMYDIPSLANLTRWGVNIVPFLDPVPMADVQVGTVLSIPCNAAVPTNCHKWRNTLRTLMTLCYEIEQP
ncbi:hypothetical protein BC828DRAFT_397412 [Blastocladiella britannica]|nr:hypothetical protein BC828DRAFT_397412 [Blastocladiella britannica]